MRLENVQLAGPGWMYIPPSLGSSSSNSRTVLRWTQSDSSVSTQYLTDLRSLTPPGLPVAPWSVSQSARRPPLFPGLSLVKMLMWKTGGIWERRRNQNHEMQPRLAWSGGAHFHGSRW